MSNIKELANVPEISFIENMSLQETEELVRANYTRIFKELTGQDAELGEADAKNLIIKSFSLVLYQVMQYVEAKGRAELLKTSTIIERAFRGYCSAQSRYRRLRRWRGRKKRADAGSARRICFPDSPVFHG